MSDNLQKLEAAVSALIAQEKSITQERIRELVSSLRASPIFLVLDDEADALVRLLESRHEITMSVGAVLEERGFQPWLDRSRAEIDPYFWTRYRSYLVAKGFSADVISTIDQVTDRILGLLENPLNEGSWDRRGMVMGHVQSGKTANYTGLICKAADAGYKLIVIIAGIHNNLRNQTQTRIDEGFIGRDSANLLAKKADRFVGVGKIDPSRRPATFTNSLRDFNRAAAVASGLGLHEIRVPTVLVIKKNSNTLRNVLEWLREHSAQGGGRIREPMLLIDDEADNASINVRNRPGEVSRINSQIRELLDTFDRCCYVGYTATPFANIFIDPEIRDEQFGRDLFPRHFIVDLDPPSNYFGARRVFIDEPETFLRPVADNEAFLPIRHKIGFQVAGLPNSLCDAIRAFILVRAIRIIRGEQRAHNSMLVNASRFTDVQRQLRNHIHAFLADVQASIRVNGALSLEKAFSDPEIRALRAVWEREFSESGVGWESILPRLNESAASIRAVEVNSRSSGALDYNAHVTDGLNVIAVGGYSLSRGLTLEGLSVSWFLRNSAMYDTLMQMGRWFGYRPGYDDLCRIWMPDEARGWYEHVTESIEELREELRRMESVGATPEDFGLRVRSHPDTLIVTARNKMGTGETVTVEIGLANSLIETTVLLRDSENLRRNFLVAEAFASALAAAGQPLERAGPSERGWLLGGVAARPIIDFIRAFRNHPRCLKTDPIPVADFIESNMTNGLEYWDVLIASRQ